MRASLARSLMGVALATSLLVAAGAGYTPRSQAAERAARLARSTQQTVTVQFAPLTGSHVQGTATLTADTGATRIGWDVSGLAAMGMGGGGGASIPVIVPGSVEVGASVQMTFGYEETA